MTATDASTSRFPDRDRNDEGKAENQRPRDRYGRPLPRGAPDELANRAEPADVVSTVDECLDHVERLFAEQRFFEAHEFLEWIWKSELIDTDDRDYWKGVTQVAVGYAHTQRGNTKGAVTLLERATQYMAPYPPSHGGVEADRLASDALRVAQAVRERGASPDHDFGRFPRVAG
jgi:hypothetical protein